jgi:DNA (cytosine-5)-methyltransferase 1
MFMENVEEFADWGPLNEDGTINRRKIGSSFRRWIKSLENLGYAVDMRELRACDYGAPTTRKRLFVIARSDGQEIVFPEASHGDGLTPYRTAAECIDWTIPCPSIFERERPLADATMRRIWRGIDRYVINDPNPFIVGIDNKSNGPRDAWPLSSPLRTITAENRFALVTPFIVNTRNGERVGQAPRVRDIREPLPTVTAQGSQGAIAVAFIAKNYGGNYQGPGVDMRTPMSTVTARDHHSLVTAFLLKYYGTDQAPELRQPLHTVTTKARFGLVMVRGEPHQIVDIGFRMLSPRELFRAQAFPDRYVIDPEVDGSPLTKTAQIRMCGNSVSPVVAEALVRANVVEQRAEVAA